jgi:hypothetical protein
MKRNFLTILLVLPTLFLASCGPEESPGNTHKYVTSTVGTVIYNCCYSAGTDCGSVYWEVLPPLTGTPVPGSPQWLAYYADNNLIAAFFEGNNWKNNYSEVPDEIVAQIRATNPTVVKRGENAYVILKDNTMPFSESNIRFALVRKDNSSSYGEEPCPGYPN